jgi:hypothetical protein
VAGEAGEVVEGGRLESAVFPYEIGKKHAFSARFTREFSKNQPVLVLCEDFNIFS